MWWIVFAKRMSRMMVFCKIHVFPPSQCVPSEMSIMRFQICLSDNVLMTNQNFATIVGAGTVTVSMSMTDTEILVRCKMFSVDSQMCSDKNPELCKVYIYICIDNGNVSAKILSRPFRCSQMRSQSISQSANISTKSKLVCLLSSTAVKLFGWFNNINKTAATHTSGLRKCSISRFTLISFFPMVAFL